MCNSVQGGRRVRMGGPRCLAAGGAGAVTACPGRWYPYLARRRRVWGWRRGVGPPRRAGAREGGCRRRVQVHRAVQCRSESLSRGGVRRSSRRAVRCGDTCQGHCPARSRLAGSTRVRVACDEPGRCVAGRGHGTARLGSGGPRHSRPGSAAAWAGAGTEVTEGSAVMPSSVAASPGPVLAVATCCRVGQSGAR